MSYKSPDLSSHALIILAVKVNYKFQLKIFLSENIQGTLNYHLKIFRFSNFVHFFALQSQVFDWTPQAFSNDSEGSEEIKKRHEDAVKALGDRISNDHVGISCEGEVRDSLKLINNFREFFCN